MLGMSASAEDIIWQEDWSGVTEFKVNPSNFNPAYTFTGFVLNEDQSFKSGTTFYNENLAGGTAPELLLAKNGGSFMVSISLNGKSGRMVLTYKSNKSISVEEITHKDPMVSEATSIGNDYEREVIVPEGTTEIQLLFTNNNSSNARIDNFKLYQGTAKKAAGLSWGKASTTATLGEEFTLTLSNANNLPVTYSSSEETVATISQEGVITLVAAGKTTLTAAFAGNDEYEAQSVSIVLTVKEKDDNPQPVEVENLTVAQALAIIDTLAAGKTSTVEYEVKGFVVGTPDFQRKADQTLYGNVNLTIADEKGGQTVLTVFRAKNYNNQNFTEETINSIKEGDEIVFHGKLQNYVKDDVKTPELTKGYVVSINGVTGINVVKAEKANDAIFNLNGQRLVKAQKGLNIIGSKKVMVK